MKIKDTQPRDAGSGRRFLATVTTLAAVALGGMPPQSLATDAASSIHPLIVNGVATFSYPATGALLLYSDANRSNLFGLCSGTLIGCRTFLTAAHCVCPDNATDATSCERQGLVDPATLQVFFQHAGLFGVATVSISPQYNFAQSGDVAVITLAEAVSGIAPSPLNTRRKPDVGTTGMVVGFGTTMAARRSPDDSGIKRQGTVTTALCSTDIPNETHVCWQFLSSGSNTCEGDSGGPLFTDLGSGAVLAGVTSGGNSFDCLAPDVGFDSDVFVNHAWIVATAGTDLGSTSCDLPAAGTASTAIFTSSGELTASGPEAALQFDVPEGTAVLRVGLNGQLGIESSSSNATNDVDLFVRAGSTPTLDAFDCADTNATPFGFCEIDSPRAGTWHVLVHLQQGDGAFQVTATTFGGASAACPGDCDGDGVITVDDVLERMRIALGEAELTSCSPASATSGGVETVADVLAALMSVVTACPAS
jgi:hypothetical protein